MHYRLIHTKGWERPIGFLLLRNPLRPWPVKIPEDYRGHVCHISLSLTLDTEYVHKLSRDVSDSILDRSLVVGGPSACRGLGIQLLSIQPLKKHVFNYSRPDGKAHLCQQRGCAGQRRCLQFIRCQNTVIKFTQQGLPFHREMTKCTFHFDSVCG